MSSVALTLTMVSEGFAIAAAEIVVYTLLLPIALFATVRHIKSGFLCLSMFCCLRILAAGLSIASESDGRSNRNNLVWSEIPRSVGLGPLLLCGFRLITRVIRNSQFRSRFRTWVIKMLYIPNILALTFVIVGGIRLSSGEIAQKRSGKRFAQIGLSVFMAIFAIYAIICFLTSFALHAVIARERRIVYGVLLAIPFVFLRILHAMSTLFRDGRTFATVNGRSTAQLCLAIIEEMIVVVIYCGIGLFAPTQKQIEKRKSLEKLQQSGIQETE